MKSGGTRNNGNRRRHSLSQAGVRAIFSCIKENGPPPHDINFKIIVVPKFGGNNGLKLSPPPYEYEDGVYVLLRLHVAIPSVLSDRVLLHRDLALLPECPWSLSGPQYSGVEPRIDLQQRYCTPKGKDEYCSHSKGAIWTMMDLDGKENFDCRVFNVYHSPKRSIHGDESPKKTEVSPHLLVSPRANRRRRTSPLSKQSSANAPMPDPCTQKSNTKIEASFNDGTGTEIVFPRPNSVRSAPEAAKSDSDVLDAKKGGERQKRTPTVSEKSNNKANITTAKERVATRSWNAEEDIKLAELVEREPNVARIAWNVLAHQMEHRSGKQCRERYVNHLKPDRRKGNWTEVEDGHIVRLQATLGNQWSKIAAALPGRSDNDVKNRWHSRMRSQKRKRVQASSDNPSKVRQLSKAFNLNKGRPSQQDGVIGSKGDLAMKETPKIGQRVQFKLVGGKMHDGTITKVSLILKSTQNKRYTVMIHYDDGESEEAALPDEDIRLVPMSNEQELSKNEIKLCQELINLHNTLKKSNETGRKTKNQVSEEGSHDSTRHNTSTDSQEGSSPSGHGDSCNTGAKGSPEEEGLGKKQPVDGSEAKDRMKPSPQASDSDISKTNDGAATSLSSPPARVSQARTAVPRNSPPTTLNVQAHAAFPHAPAPFLTLPHQKQLQLIAAAQLLSSVNPGLAVAAISQARHFQNSGMPHQGQANGIFSPQLHSNNGFPTTFFQPPVSTLSIPRLEEKQNRESMDAGLPDPPCSSSKAKDPEGL